MPTPVEFWITPPEPLFVAPASPVTVSPPAPVAFKMMPLAAPLDAMLRKVSPPAPMVVLTTLSAVPLVDAIVFGLAPVVTPIVPPPVALKPAPLVVVIASPPPVKLIVAPVLLLTFTAGFTPVLSVFVAPLKAMVPLVLFCTRMPRPVSLIVLESVTLPVP